MIELAPHLAVAIRDLPEGWNGSAWRQAERQLELRLEQTDANVASFSAFGGVQAIGTIEDGELRGIDFYLSTRWAEDGFSYDAELNVLKRDFARAVEATSAAVGEPQFTGDAADYGIEVDYDTGALFRAAWAFRHSLMTIDGCDAQGDRGPWLVVIRCLPAR